MNFKIRLSFLILLIISIVIFSCKKSETKPISDEIKAEYLVNKKEISDLINFCIDSKTKIFRNCNYIWDQDPIFYFTKYDSLQITKLDSIFKKDDLDFIFKQAVVNPKLKFDSTIISKEKLLPLNLDQAFNRNRQIREEYWNMTREKYGQVCTLSIPLFSKNRNIAIVKIGYICGMLCGEGGIYIYKKENDGSWCLIKSISDWVS